MSFHRKTSECLELRFFGYLNVTFLGLFQTRGRVRLTKKWKKNAIYCIADTWHFIYDRIFSHGCHFLYNYEIIIIFINVKLF